MSTLRLESDPVTLIVEDNGPGIPPAERSRVLERFYRAPAARNCEGGLDLAIASEIVKWHDASLKISGGPDGRGTGYGRVWPRRRSGRYPDAYRGQVAPQHRLVTMIEVDVLRACQRACRCAGRTADHQHRPPDRRR